MFLKRLFNFIPKNEFSRALGLYNTGQYRKALEKFQELKGVSQRHEDVDKDTLDLYMCETHVALGKEHAEHGRDEDAIREMETAVAIKPRFADLHYMLGTLYARRRRYPEAKGSFDRALEINNKFFRARVHRSLTLRAMGDLEQASADLAGTRHACPNFYRETLDKLVQAVRAGANEEEIALLYHELLEERPSSAQISKEIAVAAIQRGDNEEAIRELKKAVALKPDYPDLHNYLGIAYGNNGMIDDAVQEFEIALKINPYYIKARLNLALLCYENGRYEEAQAQLDEVLAVQADNQLARNLMDELRTVTDRK
jgi:Flp pilus assembly protein TadD